MATIDAVELLHDFTLNVEVRRVKQARVRLWIALHLARMAAWVGNMGLTKKQFVGVIVDDESLDTVGATEETHVNP